jgi:hypothetical protein
VVTGGAALAGAAPKYSAAPIVEARARCLRVFLTGWSRFGVFIGIFGGWWLGVDWETGDRRQEKRGRLRIED